MSYLHGRLMLSVLPNHKVSFMLVTKKFILGNGPVTQQKLHKLESCSLDSFAKASISAD